MSRLVSEHFVRIRVAVMAENLEEARQIGAAGAPERHCDWTIE